jgi:hypothetical protein
MKRKLRVPSPSHIFDELSWSGNIGGKRDSVCANSQELGAGLIVAYKEFVGDYAATGGKILQFDDCLWEIFVDDNPNSPYTGENINPGNCSGFGRRIYRH